MTCSCLHVQLQRLYLPTSIHIHRRSDTKNNHDHGAQYSVIQSVQIVVDHFAVPNAAGAKVSYSASNRRRRPLDVVFTVHDAGANSATAGVGRMSDGTYS